MMGGLRAVFFGIVATAVAQAAPYFLSEGHVDIAWSYQAGTWSAMVSDDERFPPVDLSPEDVIFVAKDRLFTEGEGSRWARPAGDAWDFTGVEAGEVVWLLPNSNNGNPLLEPGFDTGGVPFGIASEVRVNLVSVDFLGEGEGHLSLLTNVNLVHMASADGIDGEDFYVMGTGDHRHVNWIFSARGVYQVSFAASMLLVPGDETSRTTSEPVKFTFAVGLSPFELWLLGRGVPPEQAGENDSPAGDGVPNLVKYALDLEPMVAVTGPVAPLGFFEDDGVRYPALDVALNVAATDVVVRVEVSEDLAGWVSGAGHTVTLALNAGRLHARDAVPLGGGAQRFLRLAVELIPEIGIF